MRDILSGLSLLLKDIADSLTAVGAARFSFDLISMRLSTCGFRPMIAASWIWPESTVCYLQVSFPPQQRKPTRREKVS